MAKIYGELVARYMQQSGKNGECLDRCLEIYKTKKHLKAVLWDSSVLHWKSGRKPLRVEKFTVWVYAFYYKNYYIIRKKFDFTIDKGKVWVYEANSTNGTLLTEKDDNFDYEF